MKGTIVHGICVLIFFSSNIPLDSNTNLSLMKGTIVHGTHVNARIRPTIKDKFILVLELSKRATRPVLDRFMTDSGFGGPGQKVPKDKRAQKCLPKPVTLRAMGFRASLVTYSF
ncbi:hypothetical protein MTR_0007s0450 [Medicago truncatula]|uniref:Uncharacterized protein n=1 Tax=Medicago truncatula TaxID=3880 RepID=A0A072TJJ1_MEDTR|nr:hypothetical protein MTR_0007s0450 [Medicago truncatula]